MTPASLRAALHPRPPCSERVAAIKPKYLADMAEIRSQAHGQLGTLIRSAKP